ncbi:MAG: hypothetical protein Kow0047_20540 [Anaerolineae bacterium]
MAFYGWDADLFNAPLFRGLSPSVLQSILTQAEGPTSYEPGTYLFHQGADDERSQAAFLVLEGEVLETRHDEEGREILRRVVHPFEMFGYRGLPEGIGQPTSAQVQEPAEILRIPGKAFLRILDESPELRDRLWRPKVVSRLRAMPLLSGLSDEELSWVSELWYEREHPEDTQLLPRVSLPGGEASVGLIDYGQVRQGAEGKSAEQPGQVPREQRPSLVLTSGHYFGRHPSLKYHKHEIWTSCTKCRIFWITSEDFEWLLTAYPSVRAILEYRPNVRARLKRASLFSNFEEPLIDELAGYVCWDYVPRHHMIARQGVAGDALCILDQGEAIIRVTDERGQERPRAMLTPGDWFGETSLILGEPHDATVIAVAPSYWFTLHRDDFLRFLADRPEAKSRLQMRQETREKWERPSKAPISPQESIIWMTRRHWWTLARDTFWLVVSLLGLLPFLLFKVDQRIDVPLHIAVIVLLAVLIVLLVWRYIDWSDDWLIITPRRIVRLERTVLISESRLEAPLDRVQDVVVEKGFLGKLLGYGHVAIQTAATVGLISFRYLPDPDAARELILSQRERARAGLKAEEREQIRLTLRRRLPVGTFPTLSSYAVPPTEPRPHHRPPSRWERWVRRAAEVQVIGQAIALWKRVRGWRLFEVLQAVELGDLFVIADVTPERVIWRKHWFNLIERTFLPGTSVVSITIALMVIPRAMEQRGLETPYVNSTILTLMIALIGAFAWLAWQFADWRNDLYIVTQDRIIDLERTPLGFRETSREAPLERVQNVFYRIPNPLAYVLGYGDVIIQTAAETGEFRFRWVANPREVQAEILRRVEEAQARRLARERAQREEEILAWIESYHHVRRQSSDR